MSHLSKINLKLDDRQALLEALQEMGFGYKENAHRSAYNWNIDAEILVTKDGRDLSIGFSYDEKEKAFVMESDFYDTGLNTKEFQEQLNVGHNKIKTARILRENGYIVEESIDETGELLLTGTYYG